MMAVPAESEPVFSLLPWIKNSQFTRDGVFAFGFRNRKTGNLGGPSSHNFSVSGWRRKKHIFGTNKPYFLVLLTYIGITAGYHGWT